MGLNGTQAVSREIAIVQDKLSHPQRIWEALDQFEKDMYQGKISNWWKEEKAVLLNRESALRQEKATLLQIQLEQERKTCKGLLSGFLNCLFVVMDNLSSSEANPNYTRGAKSGF